MHDVTRLFHEALITRMVETIERDAECASSESRGFIKAALIVGDQLACALDRIADNLIRAPKLDTAAMAGYTNAQVLQVAPMAGNFSRDEIEAFCVGFRRCAMLLEAQ